MSAEPDPQEIDKFDRMADDWWDPKGPMAPLHTMTPCRLDHIGAQLRANFGRDFGGLTLLDVGCGGGLMSEPMARLGFDVTGIDGAQDAITAARSHAEAGGLDIDYRAETTSDLLRRGATFDVVLALEVVEHVPDARAFLTDCAALLKPGGLLMVSTLNRTARSFALAIVGAEYLLRWLPTGTHDWSKFRKPTEIDASLRRVGLEVVDHTGMTFNAISGDWSLSDEDLGVNYVVTSVRPGSD